MKKTFSVIFAIFLSAVSAISVFAYDGIYSTPQTGDKGVLLWVVIGAVAVFGAAAVIGVMKRRSDRNDEDDK